MNTQLKVTVAVCTLNREEIVRQTLEDVWQQEYSPLEVVVVDQTPELSIEMEKFYQTNQSRLKLFRMAAKGQGQARNKAWQEATSQIIFYVDDDVRLEPEVISNQLKHFNDPSVGAVTGLVNDAHGDPPTCGGRVNWYGRVRVERNVARVHQVESVSGGNMSIRRNVLEQIGGFWELTNNTVQMREETDMSLRVIKAGYQVICEPSSTLLHLAHRSGGSRSNTDRIKWYEDYFFAEYKYFLRNFPKWKLPFYVLGLSRPILSCMFYYGRAKPKALFAPIKGLIRAWQ